MSHTPIADQRLAELQRLGDEAKERHDPGEINYRLAHLGWTFMKILEFERFAMPFIGWLNSLLTRRKGESGGDPE